MKKITQNILLLLLITTFSKGIAQTFSTGLVTIDANLSFQVDITAAEVTFTMTGKSDRWFGVGFGGLTMGSTPDVAYSQGASIIDGALGSYGAPSVDANQDWMETSNTTSGGFQTIVATRDLNTGTDGDFIFSTALTSIDFVWAYGASFTFNHNGAGNRGFTSEGVTLGIQDYTLNDKFAIYPNPSNGVMNIKSDGFEISSISVFDMQGRNVKNISTNSIDSNVSINLSELSSGIYNLIIESSKGKGQKKVLIN